MRNGIDSTHASIGDRPDIFCRNWEVRHGQLPVSTCVAVASLTYMDQGHGNDLKDESEEYRIPLFFTGS